MPQNHGRVVDTAKAKGTTEGVPSSEALDFLCRHRGEGRSKIRPVIQVRQPKTAERGRWIRSYRLPTFRSCCLDSLQAREAWWTAIDALLKQWFAKRALPKGDPFGIEDLRAVRRSLARRIPLPASRARRESWYRAQVAYAGRKKAAIEARARAEAEELRVATIFSTLGLDIHATAYEIKRALQQKKLEILRNRGSLADLRRVQAAAEAALAQRIASM
ncbi:MAG: hypothetical protein JO034_15755 [Singulisphaera sp.]|nr:hypothetical protein [Singulisphaera sp.]